MQATSPFFGLRGVASDLTWWFGPVSRLRFHRPAHFLPHRPHPAALRLPDDNCRAIHPPEALRAAQRKTGIFMPQIQKQKSNTTSAWLMKKIINTECLRDYDTVNAPFAKTTAVCKKAMRHVTSRLFASSRSRLYAMTSSILTVACAVAVSLPTAVPSIASSSLDSSRDYEFRGTL